ncbi:hypothetical protein L218DRAFT_878057 [Marasmius fiardii PR-910]|nr:hypothetical protein L218DRAFT_878057 [Marasmius fiardii PR-910]
MLKGPSSPTTTTSQILVPTNEVFRSPSPKPIPSISTSPPRRTSIRWDPNLDAHPNRPGHRSYHDLESQPLLGSPSTRNHDLPYGAVSASLPSPTPVAKPDLKKLSPKWLWSRIVKKANGLPRKIKHIDIKDVGKGVLNAIPSIMLGSLFNILLGVSYGMLLFPTSAPFAGLGPMGVSLFFMTAVVSQFTFTFSSGFSGANGNMMIEVVPFFHILAQSIASQIGVEKAKEVVATTLAAYAISSLLTGLAFLLLGALKLGVIIGFFPRHILMGCIGGMGVFLIQTGITVSLRVPDDNFAYNWDFFKLMFLDTGNLALWIVPAMLALGLRLITWKWKGQLIFPIYFGIIPIIFYAVAAAARVDLNDLRGDGWVFEIVGEARNWWEVYRYFDPNLIHWKPLWATLPTQFALLFFNILHPPLNVPALSVSLKKDVDTNKELVGHGYSNLLAGVLGTVPNYLIYVHTLLCHRVGGDTRLAGFLLGIANMVLLWIGPGPISYLPVCVVGALIFVIGWDLVKEAVWDTRGRVSRMEFITIVSIMVAMTAWDFVMGVFFGIIVSCFFFVVENSQRRSIRSLHTGESVMSTVRRPSQQRAYIKEVSKQTTIIRLQGFLFFGTITHVEEAIQRLVHGPSYEQNPVRFLILDLSMVAGLDMSSAEAFVRLHRLLRQRSITMVLCGFRVESDLGSALSSVDVLGADGVELFDGFGDAIEWTENCYLKAWFRAQKELVLPFALPGRQDLDVLSPGSYTSAAGSPRRTHLNDVGFRTIANDLTPPGSPNVHPEPYNTLVKVFSSYGGISHIVPLMSYLQRMSLPAGHVLWKQGDVSNGLYVIESGVLRASYHFSMHSPAIEESMVSGTLAGELSGLSNLERNSTVWVERDAVVWKLSNEAFSRMERENPGLEMAVYRMVLKSAKVDYDILLSALATRQ